MRLHYERPTAVSESSTAAYVSVTLDIDPDDETAYTAEALTAWAEAVKAAEATAVERAKVLGFKDISGVTPPDGYEEKPLPPQGWEHLPVSFKGGDQVLITGHGICPELPAAVTCDVKDRAGEVLSSTETGYWCAVAGMERSFIFPTSALRLP